MHTKPRLSHPHLAAHLIAATFAGVIAIGMLASVTELFVRDGWPMERLAVGERIQSNPLVPGLPLATQSKDKDGIDLRHVAIQGHVATRRPADDQLTLVSPRRPPDERVGLEHGDCLNDLADAGRRIANVVPGEVIKNAVEIVAHFGRELDSRHVSREGPPRPTDQPPGGQRAERAWGDVHPSREGPPRPTDQPPGGQ